MTTETNPSLNLAAGQKVAGCYLLEHALEADADHPIWIAQDEVLGKEVSLHFLPPAVARDAAAVEALQREVKRNRPLVHPGILRVFDLVEGDGWTAIAMDSFEGRSLAAVLKEKGHFEVADVDAWLDQLCVSLEEAHRIKLIHRDLAPENIFVTSGNQLLLANFGIGRIVQDSLRKSRDEGTDLSRLSNLSPQLLEGAAPSATDDVYGVGALFFQLLTGAPVFRGPDVADQIRKSEPPRISDVRDEADDPGEEIPAGWENVIAACLNKQGDERPNRPAEIVSSIEAYAQMPASQEAEEETAEPEEIEAQETVADEPPADAESILLAPTLAAAKDETAPVADEPSAEVKEEEIEPPHLAEAEMPAKPAVAEIEPAPTSEKPAEKPAPQPAPAAAAGTAHTAPTPRPIRHYDTDEDAFSKILPRRFRFPAAVAAAVIFVLLLINGVFKSNKDEKPAVSRPLSTIDSSEQSELTSVKNSNVATTPADSAKTTGRPPAAPAVAEPPVPTAAAKAPESTPTIMAAGPATKVATPIAVVPSAPAPAPAMGEALSDKNLAARTAAIERMKADLANAEKTQQARAREQQAATAAIAETQKAINDKMKAAATAKKATEELLATRKQREEDQRTADTAAQAAQQLAQEKARAAEAARKALADFEAQNRDKLAARDKSDAEIQSLQHTLAEREKAAADLAKTAAAAETARQQQLAAIKQGEDELQQAKANAAKASAEEAQRRASVDSERKRLDDEIASMRALFDQKMKDIEDRRRQLEGGAASPSTPPAPGAGTRPAALAPSPAAETKPLVAIPAASPAASTLPLMAKSETPKPLAPEAPPAAAPAASPAGAVVNSLGLRFVRVGDVLFSIWVTRVKDFEVFAKASNLKSTAWRGPGFRQGPDHPVVNVTWNEAIAFCKWLTDREHKDGSLPANQFYRLPYDLEWSKAVGLPDETGRTPEARDMGVPDVYPWGTAWPPTKGAGNYTGEETGSDVAIKGYDDGFAWTAPVGSFAPNKFGLYDMGGNVWQWCMDSWNNESKAKVLRGASWYNGALKLSLLSSCRVHAAPDSSTDNYGFRIVRATESPAAKSGKK